jgi:nucleotide-binding universal stress UspA family protein
VIEMFNRIVVAIDTSEYSLRVIPTALEVAQKFRREVFVLHVFEHDRGRSVVYSDESTAEAMRLVADAVKLMKEGGVSADGQVHDVAAGHVAEDIVATAGAFGADLIVMGSRGLSDVQGILLGSVAHKVIHLAAIPVLVARGPIPVKVRASQPAMARLPAMAY